MQSISTWSFRSVGIFRVPAAMAARLRTLLVILAVQLQLWSPTAALGAEELKKMQQHGVVPDIIPNPPAAAATVQYGDLKVDMGNELTPTQVSNMPSITWPVEDGAYYTLIMIDADLPKFVQAKELQHWVVVNVPGTDIAKGDTIFEFITTAPPEGSGFHRYIFLIYKQPGKMEKSKYGDIKDEKLESRLSYTHSDLQEQFGLKDPVAGNFYRSQYDENVPRFNQQTMERYEKH